MPFLPILSTLLITFTIINPPVAFAETIITNSNSSTHVIIRQNINGKEYNYDNNRRSVRQVSPKPTKTPSPTPTRRILRTTSTITPTKTPTPTEITPTAGDSGSLAAVQKYIMDEINNYRQSHGLSRVETDPYTCGFAKIRAKEISSEFNHDGFTDRINAKSLPYPSYRQVTENLAMTSNYKNVVNMWINSSGHAENMRRDTPYVCVEQYGNYYAYEGWKP